MDANNPIQLGAPSAPSITNVASSNPTNCGVNDGSITITATGGSGSLEYSIGGAYQATGSFTGLAAGTYPVSVRNVGGSCIVTGQVVILDNPSQPVIDAVVGANPTDCGTIDGTITITASSPAGNVLQYSIDAGATFQLSSVFTGLVGGTYNVVVRNANGTCLVNGSQVILQDKVAPVINAVVASGPTNCSTDNGQISIGATFNPVPGVEYSIDGGLNWQVSNTFTSLGAGSYNVTIRNLDGTCTVLDINNPVVLDAPNAPAVANVSISDPTNCGAADGSIVITGSGGNGAPYQYSIDGGASFFSNNGVFTNQGGGTYNVVIRNGDGTCQVIGQTVTLQDKFPPIITNVSVGNLSNCGTTDGVITIQATSAATGSALEYTTNGGSTWQPSNVFVGLLAGAYDVRVRNIDGTCEVTYPAVIIQSPTQPVINSLLSSNPNGCNTNDGTISINASGGSLEYSIDGGLTWQSSASFTGLGAGSYIVVARNTNGSCATSYTSNPVVLTAPSAPTIVQVQSISPTDCGLVNGMLAIIAGNGSGSYEYSIDSGSTWSTDHSFNNLPAGIYYTFVRNADGSCPVQGTVVTLTPKAPPIVDVVNSTNITNCGLADGTISIIASAPFGVALEYSIDGGATYQSSNVFSNLNADTYSVRVRNADGTCATTPSMVVITAPTNPSITNVSSSNPSNCGITDGNITITAVAGSSPLEYSIDGGLNWQVSNTFNGLVAGSYNVAVRNTDGTCQVLDASNPVILTAPNAPAITSVNSTDPTDCNITDGTITITATGGTSSLEYSIDGSSWQSSNVFSSVAGGTYTTYVRNAGTPATCEVTGQTVTLTDKALPIITNVTSSNPSDCGVTDGVITITANSASGSIEYSINGGSSWQPSNIFSALSGDTYEVRVRNIDGTCMVSAPNQVLVDPILPVITSVNSTDATSCSANDGTIIITATGASLEYSINGGLTWETTANYTGLGAGTYFVAVRNATGTCMVMDANNPVVIEAPLAPAFTSVNSTDPTDCAANDATITITATGGSGNLESATGNFFLKAPSVGTTGSSHSGLSPPS